ncbi:MAG TPA: LLM class flavin-dependent oxidoreductase [Dehalococcoidia bacterium]|jgi:alkanesulfonate monooxygenase
MPINILGMIGVAPSTSTAALHVIGGGVDGDYIARFTRAHEEAGFDAVLIGHRSTSADGFLIAQHAAYHSQRIKFLVAHRPGFTAPTQAARRVATLDNLIGGRLWLHIITGGSDADQQRDGDFLTHDQRYRRTDEYLQVMRMAWTEEGPFDFAGEFYRVEGARSDVRSTQQPHVPLWFGGISDAAIPVGAKHCDTYALFGEPLAEVQALMQRLNAAAAVHNRTLRYNVSFRPIIAATEEAAWRKAREILKGVQATPPPPTDRREAESARRLIRLIESGEVHDERLWVPLAAAARGEGNTTALVGTPEQVAEAISRYYDLGISGVLIRGFDPFEDTIEFGRELIPWIRQKVAERDAARLAAV